MGVEALIGPAIVAAFIAALVSIAGWFATSYQTLRLERRRREERTRDFQIALRAEIRSELAELVRDPAINAVDWLAPASDGGMSSAVFVPRGTQNRIFEAIVKDIHILPENVIEPVVLYIRQRDVVEGFREDIRSDRYTTLSPTRQANILEDYLRLREHLRRLAETAVNALGAESGRR